MATAIAVPSRRLGRSGLAIFLGFLAVVVFHSAPTMSSIS